MKTKNNVQKTILRSVAVIVSFVLISFTVSAQDFWKKLLENSSFNEIALAMVETSKETADSKSATSNFNSELLEAEFEPALEMEDWMNNENIFSVSSFEIADEVENNLTLQDWMLDKNLFQVDQNEEMPLEVDAWMTSDKVWEM
jgi:hypothetical protein